MLPNEFIRELKKINGAKNGAKKRLVIEVPLGRQLTATSECE
jgi:glucose-6-phosphate 1-dehydrogenase